MELRKAAGFLEAQLHWLENISSEGLQSLTWNFIIAYVLCKHMC